MVFSSPYYLFALFGLVVPIGIHLWNQKSGRVIRVGSIRFLQESESSSYNSIRLNEIVLLMLRMLLILLLSLIMAGATYWTSSSTNENKIVLIDPLLKQQPQYEKLLDSLAQKDSFDLGQYFGNQTKDYWRLIELMARENEKSFVVYASNTLINFTGSRRSMPNNVKWIYLPIEPTSFLAGALLNSRDTLTVVMGEYEQQQLKLNRYGYSYNQLGTSLVINNRTIQLDKVKQQLILDADTVAIDKQPQISVQIVYDSDYITDYKYASAAINTINKLGAASITWEGLKLNDFTEQNTDWLIWLSDKQPDSNKNVIVFNSNSTRHLPNGNYSKFNLRLNPRYTKMNDISNVPKQLIDLFMIDLFSEQIEKHDLRSIDYNQLLSSEHEIVNADVTTKSSLTTYLWVLFFIALASERIISTIRKQ